MCAAFAGSSPLLDELYRIGSKGITMGLDRMRRACDLLGNPERQISAIQVTGTNGKGSVCTMLELALRKAGYRTGLFTSPHIHRFTERIRINGAEISMDTLEPLLERALSLTRGANGIPLSFFEVATLAAFLAFVRERVDVVVLEVGLGGRLDATTVTTPRVGVITSIGMDHMDWLGNSIAEIAREKAGIVKPGMTVCVGRVPDDAIHEIRAVVADCNATLFHIQEPLPLSREGMPSVAFFSQPHQPFNASVAFEAFCQYLSEEDRSHIEQLFQTAIQTIFIPCRYEWVVEGGKTFVLDGAHNLEAMQALVHTLRANHVVISKIVFGALKGKPIDEMLALLRTVCDRIVLVKAPIDRTMDVEEVSRRFGLPAMTMSDALGTHDGKQPMLITGSFFVTAEARQLLCTEKAHPQIGL